LQPHFEVAQNGIVQPPGHLFAITRNERNGSPAIEQFDGRRNLYGTGAEFLRELRKNAGVVLCRHRRLACFDGGGGGRGEIGHGVSWAAAGWRREIKTV